MISASDRPRSLAVLLAALLTLSLVAGVPATSGQATFDGGVNISLTPATDGSTAQWSLSDYDSASNVRINITGSRNSKWDNVSATGVDDGGTVSLDVGGNIDPTGPSSNDEPTISLTGKKGIEVAYASKDFYVEYTDGDQTYTTTAYTYRVGGIGDINGDGGKEIAFEDDSRNLKYVDPDTNTTTDTGEQTNNVGGVGDIDNDGETEITFVDFSDDILKYYDNDGSTVSTGLSAYKIGGIGDIDSDGVPEVAFTTGNDLKYTDASGTVTQTGITADDVGGIGDVDGDGSPEIAYRLDGSQNDINDVEFVDESGSVTSLGGGAESVGGVGDIDGDGNLEIAYSDFNTDELKFVDKNGERQTVGTTADNVGMMGDIDGDSTQDPAVDIDDDGNNEVSITGGLSGTTTREIPSLDPSDDSMTVSTSSGSVDVTIRLKERTQTVDPAVELNGSWVNVTGSLADGSTMSETIDQSALQQGTNRLNVSLGDGSLSSDAPSMQADIELNHNASDNISVNYESSQFESSYNISSTYKDATNNASATIPYGDDRVVAVQNLEYQINDGGWHSVGSSNYQFSGSSVSVDLSEAYGGELPSGATAEVRSTGRKVETANGQITVVDPTQPGDELNTQVRVDSRSSGFAINVGPTESGSRVHYATSDDFGGTAPVGSAVIEANGDQHVEFENALAGNTMRMKHLKTQVMPQQGDVRVEVQRAGSDPELDISPGPAGAGDPVEFKYYRTESGAEYILKSLTDSIVRDSDVAQSPAIFSDDDSDETLAITLDSVASTASQTGGAVGGAVAGAGQFAADQASGLLGMISLPFGGSSILWLLGLVGLGFVVFRTDLLSGSGDGLDDAGEAAGGLTRTAGRAVSGAGSGILAGLRGLLGYLGEIAAVILSNRRATIVATILLAISLSAAGVIPITEDVAILLVLAGIPIASYIGLRSNGLFSQRVWLASTAIATLVGVELVAPGTLQIAIEQLTSEAVAPLLILLVGGAAYLYYRTRQAEASTPGTVIRTVIGNDDDDGNN